MNQQNDRRALIFLILVSLFLALIFVIPPTQRLAKASSLTISNAPDFKNYIPLIVQSWPPLTTTPILSPIDNSDQDNSYVVTWQPTIFADTYYLEESSEPTFSSPALVYQGGQSFWSVPGTGKLPGTYYYRVKAENKYSATEWSEVQSITIYPLFIGLNIRWDGVGFIRGTSYYDIGSHETLHLDILTEPDTIRSNNYLWYDPNPLDFEPESWYSYYSVVSGDWKASSVPGDPSWKWGYPWFMDYDFQPVNGKTAEIYGKDFNVTGPHLGTTTFGTSIWYWEFVNKEKILLWDDGGDWKQYIHSGEAVLRYDANSSRLLIYSNILRRLYYQGDPTSDTVQYIDNTTSASSLPGSPPILLGPQQEFTYNQSYIDEFMEFENINFHR